MTQTPRPPYVPRVGRFSAYEVTGPDWSERRPHIAGGLGAELCRTCFAQGWLRRREGTRAVAVTPSGSLAFDRIFGLQLAA